MRLSSSFLLLLGALCAVSAIPAPSDLQQPQLEVEPAYTLAKFQLRLREIREIQHAASAAVLNSLYDMVRLGYGCACEYLVGTHSIEISDFPHMQLLDSMPATARG